jgi:FAD:protein FMN transferase
MRRRTFISGTLGLGAFAAVASQDASSDLALHSPLPGAELVAELNPYAGSSLAFGSIVTIKVLHSDALAAQSAIEDALREVRRVDALMSVQQERSQVYRLNRNGIVESPHEDLLRVLAFARQLSVLTGGAFDITVQPLWQAFSLATAKGGLPAVDEIAAAKSLVDWRRVEFSSGQVRIAARGSAITLNGVAQGYAVDLAIEALRRSGVQHALLDTGEFGSIGRKLQGQPWLLGVGDPRHRDAIAVRLRMDGRCVATSGDYEVFFSRDFVHHHIFDPATGDSPTELASVTVAAPTGILADGLSTAFMVMGADKALDLAARLRDVDAILIGKNGTVRKTPRFPELKA